MAEIDFTDFLLAHRCMRREYGRLAEVARHPRDVSHQTLVEKQIAVTLSLLHHHHREEDSWLWPTLRTRAPQATPALDRLEAQHAQIDPLVIAVADTTRPLPERAPILAELHQVINTHLDDEERVVLPLCSAHISAEEWGALGQRILASIPRRQLPIVLGWAYSETSTTEWTHVRKMLPRPIRLLLTTIWAPAYAKRRRRLYGPPPADRIQLAQRGYSQLVHPAEPAECGELPGQISPFATLRARLNGFRMPRREVSGRSRPAGFPPHGE